MAQTVPLTGMSALDSVSVFILPSLCCLHPHLLSCTLLSFGNMADIHAAERGPSSFASKNPFRNLVSDKKNVKPISTNPFLDSNEIAPTNSANKVTPTSGPGGATSPSSTVDQTADVFVRVLISEVTYGTDAHRQASA
jgi:hypothetical protein